MKKLLLALTLTLGLAACGGNSNQPVAGPIKTVDQQQQRQENLKAEALTIARDVGKQLGNVDSSDMYSTCLNVVPKIEADVRQLANLTDKLDATNPDPSWMAGVRRTYTTLDGAISSISAACDEL